MSCLKLFGGREEGFVVEGPHSERARFRPMNDQGLLVLVEVALVVDVGAIPARSEDGVGGNEIASLSIC